MPNDPEPADAQAPRPVRKCPICGKPALKEYRPFCSKRCADVDLQRWFTGSYAIPLSEDEGSSEDGDDQGGR